MEDDGRIAYREAVTPSNLSSLDPEQSSRKDEVLVFGHERWKSRAADHCIEHGIL